MNLREVGRIVGMLGAVLAFLVGITSVIPGFTSSTEEQSGLSLIVRGSIVIGLSVVAGYGVSLAHRNPWAASIYFFGAAVLGAIVAFRSFWLAGIVLLVAAMIAYSQREQRG